MTRPRTTTTATRRRIHRVAGQDRPRTRALPPPTPQRARPRWLRRPTFTLPRLRGRRWVTTLAVGIVLVAALTAVLGYQLHQTRATEQARTDAPAAATDAVAQILSYDHRQLDQDFAAAKQHLTGGFAREYADTTEQVVRSQAQEARAVVQADVVASSVVAADPDRVDVLLFVNQSTTSSRSETPKVDLTRVQATLQQVDGRWLVSDLAAL